MFDKYDITWCGNSPECENKSCMRHLSHMPESERKYPHSMALFAGTEYCEKEKKDSEY